MILIRNKLTKAILKVSPKLKHQYSRFSEATRGFLPDGFSVHGLRSRKRSRQLQPNRSVARGLVKMIELASWWVTLRDQLT